MKIKKPKEFISMLQFLAAHGLSFGANADAWMINFKDGVKIVLTKRGIMSLARRHFDYVGTPRLITKDELEKGTFSLEYITDARGRSVTKVSHKINPLRDTSEENIAGVYMMIREKGGAGEDCLTLGKSELVRLRNAQQSNGKDKSTAWRDYYSEQAKSRLYRQLLKYIDLTALGAVGAIGMEDDDDYIDITDDSVEDPSDPEPEQQETPEADAETGEIQEESDEEQAAEPEEAPKPKKKAAAAKKKKADETKPEPPEEQEIEEESGGEDWGNWGSS